MRNFHDQRELGALCRPGEKILFRNYFVVACRNLKRTRVFSAVNILGLAIGMTASLLILHYVKFEENYDRFHEHSDRIYRLRYERTDESGQSVRFASCCPPAAARIRGNYPEVEKIGRAVSYQALISRGDARFLEERIYFAEPELLDVLQFKFIEGDPLSDLRQPNKAFISRSTAKKYFDDQNPIGQTISANQRTDYEVVGVFEDIPQNSHLKFDILLPWANLAAMMGPEYTEAWGHTGSYTYLLAREGTDPRAFEKKLLTLVEAECPWLKDYNMTIDLKMQPLTDIHLNSNFMQEYEANGSRTSVDVLFKIAVFIMIMAWVNFVNLSTAAAVNRAKEVGLRKVVGASRRQLMAQFFSEITVINTVSLVCAITLAALVLPLFNRFTGMPSNYVLWTHGWFWLIAAVMLAAGVFMSGLYPVVAMSSFHPISVLKGRFAASAKGVRLRKALVIFQFTVGLVLLIATFTVFQQISFMRSQALGFSIDQTLVVRAPRVRGDSYDSKFESFKEALLQRVDIDKLCHVTEVPGRQIYWDAGAIHKAGEDISQSSNYQIVGVDYDFVDLFELEFVAGRNFSREFPADKDALILNETAVQLMGFENAESAVGDKVDYWGEIYPIIGVLKDFHQQSLKVDFEPHIFRFMPYGRGAMGMMAMKLSSHDVTETIQAVRQQYDKFFPGNSFDYFFLDDYFNQQYESDVLFGRVFSLFSMLAMVIIALGVYGLASFSTTQLTKQIGIRKVLGASANNIVGMLTKEFVILVAIANVIAWPVAYWGMNRWLEGFAYRTDMSIAVFVLAGISTLLIALLAVSRQVIKAAHANPVDAIQHE